MKVVLFTCYPLHAGQVWRTVHQSLQLAATRLCGFVERKDPVVALWPRGPVGEAGELRDFGGVMVVQPPAACLVLRPTTIMFPMQSSSRGVMTAAF